MKKYNKAEDIQLIQYAQLPGQGNAQNYFPQNYKPFLKILEKDSGCDNPQKRQVQINQGRLFAAYEAKDIEHCTDVDYNDLMIRARAMIADNDRNNRAAIVVARVMFIHRRVGLMTELYKKLINHVNQMQDLDTIVIESVLTPEMHMWCKKHGFILSKFYYNTYYKIIK